MIIKMNSQYFSNIEEKTHSKLLQEATYQLEELHEKEEEQKYSPKFYEELNRCNMKRKLGKYNVKVSEGAPQHNLKEIHQERLSDKKKKKKYGQEDTSEVALIRRFQEAGYNQDIVKLFEPDYVRNNFWTAQNKIDEMTVLVLFFFLY